MCDGRTRGSSSSDCGAATVPMPTVEREGERTLDNLRARARCIVRTQQRVCLRAVVLLRRAERAESHSYLWNTSGI